MSEIKMGNVTLTWKEANSEKLQYTNFGLSDHQGMINGKRGNWVLVKISTHGIIGDKNVDH